MEKSDVLKGFINHLMEFFNDVKVLFPNNKDIEKAYIGLDSLRKINPRLIIDTWKTNIVDKYKNEIESGSIDFFINKSYMEDVENSDILKKIEQLRGPIRLMSDESKLKTITYMQNLTKLCDIYYSK